MLRSHAPPQRHRASASMHPAYCGGGATLTTGAFNRPSWPAPSTLQHAAPHEDGSHRHSQKRKVCTCAGATLTRSSCRKPSTPGPCIQETQPKPSMHALRSSVADGRLMRHPRLAPHPSSLGGLPGAALKVPVFPTMAQLCSHTDACADRRQGADHSLPMQQCRHRGPIAAASTGDVRCVLCTQLAAAAPGQGAGK